ncbi:hypothetical protein BN1723_019342, partial [Verticillium longisporum]
MISADTPRVLEQIESSFELNPKDAVLVSAKTGEVGIQYPSAVPQSVLRAGQVGYIHFNPGMKRIQDAKLGD